MPDTPYAPPVVFSLHGINTYAGWQKTFGEFLGDHKIPFRLFDFGRYVLRFFRKSQNEAMVDRFYKYYQDELEKLGPGVVDPADHTKRPSVVAHSFGSYIVGYAMEKYEDMKFDKVLVCGSVLPRAFDWSLLVARDQVNKVRNEYGVQDFWTWVVGYVVPRTGDGGHRGFSLDCSFLEQKRFEKFNHSDFFTRRHFDTYWLPFVRRPPSPLTVVHSRTVTDPARLAAIRTGSRTVDDACYGADPVYDQVVIPYDLPTAWLKVNPDLYTYLIDRRDGTCSGYLNAMPLLPEAFEKVKAGKSRDNTIAPADVDTYTADVPVRLYIMSIATDPALRADDPVLANEGFERLLNGLCDKLVYYAVEKNIRVTEIAAVAWTDTGLRLCKLLGMAEVAKDEFGHPVYHVDLTEDRVKERRTIPGLERLLAVYRKLPDLPGGP